ncbi:hypothetical protein B0T10DRAFT_605510 [Thelonectria olida]|uniref:Uncharacterized protein n=1 Tax=Thelonectria olida TaxID=1576542 RepID=A0A9P8W9U5_9HYPO|nr:hypothetical protein B0T10DRAFT_605510 [Thelonectria olida]
MIEMLIGRRLENPGDRNNEDVANASGRGAFLELQNSLAYNQGQHSRELCTCVLDKIIAAILHASILHASIQAKHPHDHLQTQPVRAHWRILYRRDLYNWQLEAWLNAQLATTLGSNGPIPAQPSAHGRIIVGYEIQQILFEQETNIYSRLRFPFHETDSEKALHEGRVCSALARFFLLCPVDAGAVNGARPGSARSD